MVLSAPFFGPKASSFSFFQGFLSLFPRCSVSFSKVSYFSNLSALPPSLAAFSLFSQCCDGDDDGLGSDYGDEGDVDFGDDEGDVGDEDKQGNHVPGCLPHRCCHHPSRSEQKLVSHDGDPIMIITLLTIMIIYFVKTNYFE